MKILTLNYFSWKAKMTMLYIYIKKQINQFLFVDEIALKIIDRKLSKLLYSQN